MGLSSLFCLDRKITTTREEETPSLPHRSPSLSRISSKRKKQTDSFLAPRKKRAKEEEKAFKKYSKKQPFFQQQKITKKLEITWTVFRYPGGQGYLFRFRPDFVAFTRGRALSRGGRFLF